MTVTDDLDLGTKEKVLPCEYESSITYHSKAVTNIKVFLLTKRQTNRAKTVCSLSTKGRASKGDMNCVVLVGFFFFFKQVNFTNKPYTTITKPIKGCKKSGIVWKEIADQNTRPSSSSQEKKSV